MNNVAEFIATCAWQMHCQAWDSFAGGHGRHMATIVSAALLMLCQSTFCCHAKVAFATCCQGLIIWANPCGLVMAIAWCFQRACTVMSPSGCVCSHHSFPYLTLSSHQTAFAGDCHCSQNGVLGSHSLVLASRMTLCQVSLHQEVNAQCKGRLIDAVVLKFAALLASEAAWVSQSMLSPLWAGNKLYEMLDQSSMPYFQLPQHCCVNLAVIFRPKAPCSNLSLHAASTNDMQFVMLG